MLYDNTPGEFTFYANGTLERTHCDCFQPDEGQNFSEIHTKADQMLGASTGGYHETFSNMHIYYSGGWNNFNGTQVSDNRQIWANSWISQTNIQIWDYACST